MDQRSYFARALAFAAAVGRACALSVPTVRVYAPAFPLDVVDASVPSVAWKQLRLEGAGGPSLVGLVAGAPVKKRRRKTRRARARSLPPETWMVRGRVAAPPRLPRGYSAGPDAAGVSTGSSPGSRGGAGGGCHVDIPWSRRRRGSTPGSRGGAGAGARTRRPRLVCVGRGRVRRALRGDGRVRRRRGDAVPRGRVPGGLAKLSGAFKMTRGESRRRRGRDVDIP